MPPKGKRTFRKKGGSSIQKRLKKLEIAQKADENRTERKSLYKNDVNMVNTTWQSLQRFCMVPLNQDVTTDGRIGNSVNLRSLNIKFHFNFPRGTDGVSTLGASNSSTRVRLILIHNYKGMQTFAIGDILKTPTYKQTSYFQDEVAEGKRYKVLGDYKFNLNNADKSDHMIDFKMKLPKAGRVITYPSDGSTVPADFNITMFWTCEDISPLSPNQPNMFYYLKSSYEDA